MEMKRRTAFKVAVYGVLAACGFAKPSKSLATGGVVKTVPVIPGQLPSPEVVTTESIKNACITSQHVVDTVTGEESEYAYLALRVKASDQFEMFDLEL